VVKITAPRDPDRAAIRRIVAAAFGRDDEADIVEGVRAEGAILVELAAWKTPRRMVGHVLFTRMRCPDPRRRIAALGPVAVTPTVQRLGVGQALCRRGIDLCRALGAEAVVVLGHPDYYPRFGFSAEAVRMIESPFSGNPAFMALALKPGALDEPLKLDYPAAFG
jgi:putative acetyltransferase